MKIFSQKIKDAKKIKVQSTSGQAITEYAAMLAIFIGLTWILITLIRVFANYGWRILGLVGMDYP